MLSRSLGVAMAVAAALVIAGAASGHGRADRSPRPAADARRLSRQPIADNSAWHKYDEAPADFRVTPARVIRVTGDVSDPQALATPGSGQTTTLTYTPGGSAPSLVLDYGREIGGFGTFIVAATTGATLQAAYSETLANLSSTGDQSVTAGAAAGGNPTRVDDFPVATPGAFTAPVVQGAERYELVTLTSPGSVTLSGAGIDFTPLRATPSAIQGHFLSSDDLLNRIWYAGAYTLNLNELTPGTTVEPGGVNQLHLLLDGAKRDRAVWSGDHMIADLTDYYASDPRYVRDSLALFAEHPGTVAGQGTPADGTQSQPGPLPGFCSPDPQANNQCNTWSASYSVVFVPELYRYYLYTGDVSFVRQYWQSVVRQMQWDAQQVDANGLFSVSSSDDADWNVENVAGELTYVNALYEQALRSAADLATTLGYRAQAGSWAAAAARLRAAVNTKLWDAKTGVYDASTTERGSVVQDANVTAILAGIASPARARGIIGVMARALRSPYGPLNVSSPAPQGYSRIISPYIGSFNVLADFAAGRESAALSLIRIEWGWMVNHDPGGTDWEKIELNGTLTALDSAAHAWSTGPTAALSQYVLGVAPVATGYARWVVAPQPGGLRWAQGTVPSPRGSLSVRWRDRGRDSFVLTVLAPRGTSGTVAIPLMGARRVIAEDGRVVWSGRRAVGRARARLVNGTVQFTGVRGSHTYAWAR